jgi:tight adherence protein C
MITSRAGYFRRLNRVRHRSLRKLRLRFDQVGDLAVRNDGERDLRRGDGCFSDNTIIFFLIAVVIGFFAPDFWLAHATKKRRERLRLSLPDGLDLLSICLEAGLGLDQGVVRVGQELHVSHPELSEELLLVNFEQRAGVQRNAAWQSFATRANFESARSFVAMLIQTDRFGTPIAKSLGAFSDALRTQRRQKAEEMAAKTTIKLVPPLVFFIFPSMGVVVVGPAVIAVGDFFAHFLK